VNYLELAVVFLTVMVLFLVLVGLYQLREVTRMRLRITYLEGTLDLVLQSQTTTEKLLIAFLENS
jgi:hypothetical protein